MKRWKNDRSCLCTSAELYEVGSESEEKLAVLCNDPSLVAKVRLVCHNVLEARKSANLYVERKALGAGERWGRRGQGVDAASYITRNVAGPNSEVAKAHRIAEKLRRDRSRRKRCKIQQ